ncbi:MAG: translational GTPase TypA [Planctomycetaceae bacterium]|nr:translational GTPase TypA [Planctomycetaceae bacterium]
MQIRNIAIIAHVDHGKTTLVDKMLYQSGMFRSADLDKLAGGQHGLIMDRDDLERERGITIFSKNCAISYQAADGEAYKINIVDTPGHADFGGEVERVLTMADGALLLVDAFEGPRPQTRFVLRKALEHNLKLIVVVNKMDRPDARPDNVINEVFDLLVELDANDDALDFPVIYASAKDGWATTDLAQDSADLRPLFERMITHLPAPEHDLDAPLQMLITSLEYCEYTGRIGVGRVVNGTVGEGQLVAVTDRHGEATMQRVGQLYQFEGLERRRCDNAQAGDICALGGLDPMNIGDTIACPEHGKPLDTIDVDEPTMQLTVLVNDGPFSGRDGDFLTSRQIKARLDRELQSNVALRVEQGASQKEFLLAGRGVMHLGILLENMRREGFEMCAGKPRVIFRDIDNRRHEPIETLVVDCPADCQTPVMGLIGDRRAELTSMDTGAGSSGYIHMSFTIPARGLIGLRSRMLTATQGRAIMHHTFLEYAPMRGDIPQRNLGVLVTTETGPVTAYALDALYDRGIFFVTPGDQVYAGQIVGEHCKDNDIDVNATRTKKHTNIRAAGKDAAAQVRPVRRMSLEACLEYIQDDELVEITPKATRLRKRVLNESDRRRETRRAASAAVADSAI